MVLKFFEYDVCSVLFHGDMEMSYNWPRLGTWFWRFVKNRVPNSGHSFWTSKNDRIKNLKKDSETSSFFLSIDPYLGFWNAKIKELTPSTKHDPKNWHLTFFH
jgi:hypothetical protein